MAERLLCAIPARGGSKRLPRKNLRELAGKPLIAHTIEAAKSSKLFDDIYVCTDDAETAEVSRCYGAAVPLLMPPELCGDLVPSHIPCQHLAAHLGREAPFDTLVCLQPSSPLRAEQDLKSALDRFRENRFNFLVSVTAIDPHDFHWAVVPNGDHNWHMYFGAEYLRERPLLPPVFRPNGSIKIARLKALAETGHFFGEGMGVIETPPERSVHVAVEFDLKLCALILAERPQ